MLGSSLLVKNCRCTAALLYERRPSPVKPQDLRVKDGERVRETRSAPLLLATDTPPLLDFRADADMHNVARACVSGRAVSKVLEDPVLSSLCSWIKL